MGNPHRVSEPLEATFQQHSVQNDTENSMPCSQSNNTLPRTPVFGLSFLTDYRPSHEQAIFHLHTPMASSSPMCDDQSFPSSLSSQSQPRLRPRVDDGFTERIMGRTEHSHRTSVAKPQSDCDIRKMLPRQKRARNQSDQRGRSSLRASKEKATTTLYDCVPSTLGQSNVTTFTPGEPVAQALLRDRGHVPHTLKQNHLEALSLNESSTEIMLSRHDISARFHAELSNHSTDIEETFHHSPRSSVDKTYVTDGSIHDLSTMQPPTESSLETRSMPPIDLTRAKSRARRCRSLSRVRLAISTYNVSLTLTNTSTMNTIEQTYDFLGDDDFLPWLPLEESIDLCDMREACQKFTTSWIPVLCDLLHEKFPETRALSELPNELAKGLMSARMVELI